MAGEYGESIKSRSVMRRLAVQDPNRLVEEIERLRDDLDRWKDKAEAFDLALAEITPALNGVRDPAALTAAVRDYLDALDRAQSVPASQRYKSRDYLLAIADKDDALARIRAEMGGESDER